MDEPKSAEWGPQNRAHNATRFFYWLHRYKNLLLSKGWIILLTVGLAVGVQKAIFLHAKPNFRSEGRMIVSARLSLPNDQTYADELNNFYGTQVALMESDSVTNEVSLRLQAMQATNASLHPSPVKLEVTVSPKTSIFNLQAVGEDPAYTRAYLEGIMEEYINLKKNLMVNSLDSTRYGLQVQLAQTEQQLEQSQQAVLNYQASNSVVFLQQNGGNNAADYLASLNTQLADDRSELQLLQKLTLDENLERAQGVFAPATVGAQPLPSLPASLPTFSGGSVPGNSPPASAEKDPSPNNAASTLGEFEQAYLQAKQQLLLLEAKREDLARYLRPKHPKIISMNQEIADQEKLMEIFKGQSLDELENSRHTLDAKIQNLEASIKEWEVKAVDVSKKLSNYDTLKSNVARLQNVHDQLQMTIQTLDVDKQIGGENVGILEPASPTASVTRGSSRKVIAIFLGLMLGAGILLLLDGLDDRPVFFSELEQLFVEPVLGQIPRVKPKNKKAGLAILQLNDNRHALVEANRNLRSSILLLNTPPNSLKRLVITSAIPGEGKSFTAANLAISLALTGERVLLVDADLRRGVMHQCFSTSQTSGLAEVIAEQFDWAKAVIQTSIPNLCLLPCGKPSPQTGDLFVRKAGKFLQEIAGQYDYYLFDTPPIMAANDVFDLAPHVDGLILVVRAGFTSGRVAQAALKSLYLRKVNVLGLVFNAVQPNAGEYHYYRYKDYHTVTRTS